MPYHIEEVKGGAFVVGPSGRKSKEPLSMETAKKQRTALNIAKARSHGHVIPMPVKEFKAEHKRLVRTLEHGSKAKLMAEAARQRAELKERLG